MRMMLVLSVAMVLFLSGCAVHKDWAATGGSRADAVVQLSYEYGEFEQPIVDDQQGLELAIQRCQSWGYADAEAFGGISRVQNTSSTWLVTKQYQCIGQGKETAAPKKANVRKK